VEAKEDAAGAFAASQNSFGDLENSFFKIVMVAEGLGYKEA